MHIAQTRFVNFRNISQISVEWDKGLNLLSGPNGSGKTNILESLHILTGWGPFAGAKIYDTVKWNYETARLAAGTEGEHSTVVEASIVSRASLRIDGKICRWGDLRNNVQSLAFLPSDIALIEGSPAVRRRFLDVLCALYFPLYARKIADYRKILAHRRYLLSLGHPVTVTQATMADLAVWVWKCRLSVVEELKKCLNEWENLLPRPLEIELKRGGSCGSDDLSEDFERSCVIHESHERAACTPLVGPHRDELFLTCDGRPASGSLSRGQRRRIALALTLAAGRAVEKRYRSTPVLLFDEVTSELDEHGRLILLECFERTGWQIFAATAESFPRDFKGTTWKISSGNVEKI